MDSQPTVARSRQGSSKFRDHAFLSFGFRPFFLAAGVYAVLPMAAWILWIGIHASGGAIVKPTIAEPPHLWHAHEMVFGFAVAAVSGFLLTAVPSWTGAPRLKGMPLLGLFLLWLAGRSVMWFTAYLPPFFVGIIDLPYLPVLAFVAARQLAYKPATRNVALVSVISILFLCNLLFHLGKTVTISVTVADSLKLGIFALVLMITVIGGRVVPNFTRNVLMRDSSSKSPVSHPVLDGISVFSVALLLVAVGFDASSSLQGFVAIVAAIANAARLSQWRTADVLRGDPILWVLHLGYGWLVLGLVLYSAGQFDFLVSEVGGLHALSVGAIGTMIIAVMSRAALGHTGRPIKAPPLLVPSYLLISVAALIRVFGPGLVPSLYNEIMLVAGLCWMLAYSIFVVIYFPILTGSRLRK